MIIEIIVASVVTMVAFILGLAGTVIAIKKLGGDSEHKARMKYWEDKTESLSKECKCKDK